MKTLIALLLTVFSASAQVVQKPTLEILGLQTSETVRLKVQYKSETPRIYAVWHSPDLKNWSRAALEYDIEGSARENVCISVDTNSFPDIFYTMKKVGPKGFYKVDRFIPKGFVYIRNLALGSRGPDVANLQTFLEEKGYLYYWEFWYDATKGFFGERTQAALSAFQHAHGISPASGYFGPITRAVVNSMSAE